MFDLMMSFLDNPWALLRHGMNAKPRRCSYKIKYWHPVTGEIFAMRDPIANWFLGTDKCCTVVRYPWGNQPLPEATP